MSKRAFIEKCFMDEKGRIVVASMPNPPIIVWFMATVVGWIFDGVVGQTLNIVAFGALFTWAWLELFDGVNYFRRAMGLVVLVLIIWHRLG